MSLKTLAKKTTPAPALAQTEAAPLVRAEVIAKALDVHRRTVCLWAQNGTIPCRRIGGIVRFSLEAVLGAVQ